jgi:hypothetical protein
MNLEVGDFATLMLGGKKKNVRVVGFSADLHSGETWVHVRVNNDSFAGLGAALHYTVSPKQLTKINFVTDASKRRFAGQFEGR